ncbi:MAG: beta strand repeat-containing protein, partial [Pseudanabaena sp.]
MPKGTGINNDVYIVGSLELQDELFLGFTTQSGASRQITAQGSATDVHIELLPKGDGVIRTRTGYAADILDDRDIINLEYFKTRLGTLATSSLLQAPTATEDTYGIVYDHANTRFTLAPTGASLTFDNGLTKSGSNVRLGGALLVDTTITGAFDINLGTIGSKLNNFNVHTSQGVDIRGLVHGRVRIDGTNGQTWIYGGSVDSYLLVNDDGAIIVADLQAGAAQRGIRGSANYSANYQANDYIQKLYADSKIVSRNISASLASPGAGQNGYAITWDHANSRFTLSLAGGGGGGVGLPINDNQVLIQNLADNTKQFRFDAGSISTSTIRVYTVPNTNGTLALISNITAAQAGAWSLASGGTLIDNNTITMGSHTITFTGNRVTFTPNATTAGLNVGSFSTSPSSLALGDIWYNSSVDNFQGRVATGTRLLTVSIGIVDTRIPFGLGTINELTTSANLTYNGTTLLVGGTSPTASTTLDVRGIGTTSSTFGLRVANSANVTRLTLNDEGTLNLTTTVTTHTWIGTSYQGWSSLIGAGGGANIQVGQIISIAGGTNPFRFDLSSIPTGGAAMEIRETTSDTNIGGANSGAFILTKGGFTRNSGTNTHTHLQLNPTYNTTASYSGTINGIDYNPTLTSLTGATHIAWRNTSGSMLIGGTSLTNANTILDIQSTTQGFALPRMTDTQRNAIGSPYSGLQIHSTTSNRPNWHNGTVWQETASRGDLNGWLTGSLNSNTSIDYSGYEITFNGGDGLGGGGRFRVFNQEAVEEVFFGEAGNVGRGGLKYGNDYSSDYTDRSLVDRGYVLGAKTFTGRQTFATGNNGSLVVGTNTVDDSSPVNGLIMYNTTSNTFRFRQNGA